MSNAVIIAIALTTVAVFEYSSYTTASGLSARSPPLPWLSSLPHFSPFKPNSGGRRTLSLLLLEVQDSVPLNCRQVLARRGNGLASLYWRPPVQTSIPPIRLSIAEMFRDDKPFLWRIMQREEERWRRRRGRRGGGLSSQSFGVLPVGPTFLSPSLSQGQWASSVADHSDPSLRNSLPVTWVTALEEPVVLAELMQEEMKYDYLRALPPSPVTSVTHRLTCLKMDVPVPAPPAAPGTPR
ncbi:unnamed protein product [Pleuronectes platessa]|uniref:Uncharacterized protein n=1 Tax=Pleuronectes platessa TaxID=8262 RepID=A0A9N7VJA1_PLEPL|nr:unnamed protein product [Pleuronectes platessa]